VKRLAVYARRIRTGVVIVSMVAATLLTPVAVPVAVIVRWMRRDDRRTEHVVTAPNVRLLPGR
jgi:hypothetical protein